MSRRLVIAASAGNHAQGGRLARLRANLERRTVMSVTQEMTAQAQTGIREGFTTVTPYVRVRDAGLVDFLMTVFGAVETSVTPTGGGVHREVRVGDSMLMIGEGGPAEAPTALGAFHIYVPDVEAAYARAIAAGATSLGAPEDRSYGERAGFVADRFGNHWYIATHLGPTAVPQGLRTVTPFIHPRGGSASYIDFLTRALGAVEEFRHEVQGKVVHAQVRIGDAAMEMGDGEVEPMHRAFYLYVADCDALYERAVSAGADAVAPPETKWYGDRVGTVRDAAGVTWHIAKPA